MPHEVTRRQFLTHSTRGLFGVALGAMLHRELRDIHFGDRSDAFVLDASD